MAAAADAAGESPAASQGQGALLWEYQNSPPGARRFQSTFPFTRVPFWVPIFDPQSCQLAAAVGPAE